MKEPSKNTVDDCSVIDLPKIQNNAGNITPVHTNSDVPFQIQRVYYLYDIPGGEVRGGHAHKILRQLVVAASGSFEVLLDDGKKKNTIMLNQPYKGLLIVPGIWRELINFSSGAICLVLASEIYDENDYIRSYSTFTNFKNLLS